MGNCPEFHSCESNFLQNPYFSTALGEKESQKSLKISEKYAYVIHIWIVRIYCKKKAQNREISRFEQFLSTRFWQKVCKEDWKSNSTVESPAKSLLMIKNQVPLDNILTCTHTEPDLKRCFRTTTASVAFTFSFLWNQNRLKISVSILTHGT